MLRLIGHAQAGRTPSDELALQRKWFLSVCIGDDISLCLDGTNIDHRPLSF